MATPGAVIGLPLLLLAWAERCWRLLALTVAYLIVAIMKPLTDEPRGMPEFGLRPLDGHRFMLGPAVRH